MLLNIKIIGSQPEKLDFVIKNLQNEKHLEINFIDYKFNKLKEELILEMKRNILEKKFNYEKKSNDYFNDLKKSIFNNNNNNNIVINTNQEILRKNSGLLAIQEENLIEDISQTNKKHDCSNEMNPMKIEYQNDEIYFPNKDLNFNFYKEEENLYFDKDEKKLSGNNFYKQQQTGSKTGIHYSKKSVSSSSQLNDNENLFVQQKTVFQFKFL